MSELNEMRLRLLKMKAQRYWYRLGSARPPVEGIDEREFELRCYEHFLEGYLREKRRPPEYPAYQHDELAPCFRAVMTDLLGNHVSLGCITLSAAIEHIRSH